MKIYIPIWEQIWNDREFKKPVAVWHRHRACKCLTHPVGDFQEPVPAEKSCAYSTVLRTFLLFEAVFFLREELTRALKSGLPR